VNLTTTSINVGNSTVNTVITSTSINTDGTLDVLNAATLSNTLSVGGNVTISTDYSIVVVSNTDIGTSTNNFVKVFSFNKSSFSSAKITTQAKTNNNANTQISEIVLAHDGNTSFLTVYGTVSSPINSNVGVYSTQINMNEVELLFKQNMANSNIKVIAHLIK
ncbi:hypothetical protein EB118_21170, partial [bacterium]|nr:hypothetical protein [bacterium]NDG32570.1 hypothetical protein [bacterium]